MSKGDTLKRAGDVANFIFDQEDGIPNVLTPKPKTKSVISNNELRSKLAKFGLKTRGNKETLLARLREHENKMKTESPNVLNENFGM